MPAGTRLSAPSSGQFAALGGYLFLPLGLPFLVAVSFYLARHTRQATR
jgi:hypothetical protein